MAYDTSPLNPAPKPTRSEDYVLVNECKGDWAFAPMSMILDSDAQMVVLGKLYDWKMIRQNEGGVPPKFLKTNDSTLAPLMKKALIKHVRYPYIRLTEMGRRVYELNYYMVKVRRDADRQRKREEREARQKFMYGDSLTARHSRR